MWVGEVRWEALGNGGLHGGAAGGGTKHRWASKEEGFSDCGATCIKEECHTIKTQNTQQSTLHTHTSYQISGEYARGCGCQACDEAQQLHHEIPMCASTDLQGCQRRVCSRTCTFTLFSFFFAYADVLEISAVTPDLAHSRGYTPCVPHTRMHAYLHMAFWFPCHFEGTVLILQWDFTLLSVMSYYIIQQTVAGVEDLGFSATLGAHYSPITACMTMWKKRLR